jgi:predicted ATPase/class 3 adenylate cyclase
MGLDAPAPPTGTITFLFSDVVGSTQLWADPEAGMSRSLRVHDEILRELTARHGGHVFATGGDSFAVAFARASAAVACAEEIQAAIAGAEWGGGPALRVRVGLHLGEVEERGGNYFGLAVSQASRVMSVAHGGQCVLTDGVRDAAGARTTDLGVHVLRGIDHPVHLNQLGFESFPPLQSVGAEVVSLPTPRTSLIGREVQVEEIRRLLGQHRIVTLVGVGGCGKTRLAIEVAYREARAFADGVWFVDLSSVLDDFALPGAFASALHLSISPSEAAVDQIAAYLTGRRTLLVVDNCEQVVDAVAALLDQLLAAASGLRVLATSRETTDVEGEYAWKVPSLGTGADTAAVELFFDRAGAAGATLTSGDEDWRIVSDIVEHLDGLPLAIELAAARARNMGLVEIRDRLGDRFRLLAGGSRRSQQRQATLEGAVHWSYDLLNEPEREMLQTLSVFQGGFDSRDVAAVAGLSEYDAIDLIDSLANKSLVDVARDGRGRVRHRMLETIRMFALQRLIDAGRADEVRDRHLEHFAQDPAGRSLDHWLQLATATRIGREYENFRAALTWAIERDRLADAVRLAAIGHEAAGHRGEVALAINVLRTPVELEPRDRINADASLAYELLWLGDVGGATEAIRSALDRNEEYPCDFSIFAIVTEGLLLGIMGEPARMVERFDAAQRLADEHWGETVRVFASYPPGLAEVQALAYAAAIERLDRALRGPRIIFTHLAEANRAWALLAAGRVAEALAAVDGFSEVPLGSQWEHIDLIVTQVVRAHDVGPDEAARTLATAARELVARQPQVRSAILQAFAYLALLRGDEDRAHEITSLTLPITSEQLWNWMVLRPLGATPDTFFDVRSRYEREHPLLERFVADADNSRRLFDEEVARWS